MTPAAQDDIGALEEDFKSLRTAYEKYFAGVERLEPLKERDKVKTTLRRLMTVRTPNTAHRYRLQSLQASIITYESYWNRITRQIEEGTYHRDLFRLARKEQETKEKAPREAPVPPLEISPTPAVAKTAPPVSSTARPPETDSMRTLYDAFVKARAETGDKRPITLEALTATVTKQKAAIKERFKCERVEFTVAVKDGKAILKAIPK